MLLALSFTNLLFGSVTHSFGCPYHLPMSMETSALSPYCLGMSSHPALFLHCLLAVWMTKQSVGISDHRVFPVPRVSALFPVEPRPGLEGSFRSYWVGEHSFPSSLTPCIVLSLRASVSIRFVSSAIPQDWICFCCTVTTPGLFVQTTRKQRDSDGPIFRTGPWSSYFPFLFCYPLRKNVGISETHADTSASWSTARKATVGEIGSQVFCFLCPHLCHM